MQVSRYVVDAVVLERRSVREVARAHGVCKSWVAELVARFRAGGYDAIAPRSKAPHRVANRTSPGLEDQIVALRKQLTEDGFDAGAQTIHYHLSQRLTEAPSVATIWRVLRRRGFVTPQPQKRPRSSWVRFEAALPNEMWQSDMTHVDLADGGHAEVVNFLDDHSRLITACRAVTVATAGDVVEIFREAAGTWGTPASVLTDNGAIYTAAYRNGRCAMETEMLARGIAYKHSAPYHPQTCGKVERFHQTLKVYLAKQPKAATIAELQTQLDTFVAYYNEVRPHRACGRRPPRAAFDARDKAVPLGRKVEVTSGMRVRHDKVDSTGVITLRHHGRLHHIAIGRAHKGTRVVVLVHELDIRVLTENGEVMRHLTLDPSRDYQSVARTEVATMSRHMRPA